MKLPSYLRITKHNVYVFRRRIPIHLLKHFTTNEIRKSLGSVDKRVAIINSRLLALEADNLFYSLEGNVELDASISSGLLNLLKHKKELMAKDEKIVAMELLLSESVSHRISSQKAILAQHEREINLMKDVMAVGSIKSATARKNDFMLKEAVSQFFDPDEVAERGDKLATIRKDRDSLKLFVEIVGDKFISEVDQTDAVKFKKSVPLHGRKDGRKRAVGTVNGFMNSVSKFSGWFAANHSESGHAKLDFSKLRGKKTKRASEERDAFTNDEVLMILNHPELATYKTVDPAKYWLPYIAAYSGARLEEISQLCPVNDIYKEGEIWVFDINEHGSKSLKNDPSIRKIPIHTKLIEMGLIEYVEGLKKAKATTFFPDEKMRDGRTGKNAGKRVNRFIQKVVGIENKSLHSFRHTFTTILKRAYVNEAIAAAIVGHQHGSITYERYGKEYLVSTLKPTVEKIDFY